MPQFILYRDRQLWRRASARRLGSGTRRSRPSRESDRQSLFRRSRHRGRRRVRARRHGREDYIELSQHPDLWHPLRGPALALRHAAGGLARPLYELAMAHYVPGETVFCSHPLDLGTRVAAEKLSAPVASIDLAPAMLWSVYDSPRLKGALVRPASPRSGSSARSTGCRTRSSSNQFSMSRSTACAATSACPA